MKIRHGFVSNSSTNSFVCDVCGEEVMGRDIILLDCEMYRCVRGHTFCERHSPNISHPYNWEVEDQLSYLRDEVQRNSWYKGKINEELLQCRTEEDIGDHLREELKDAIEYISDEWEYEVLPRFCPVCLMNTITNEDAISYLLKVSGTSMEEVKKKVKETFSTYEDLEEFIG